VPCYRETPGALWKAGGVTNVLDERGRVVPLRGGAKLSITSLIADYDGMTGQPYPHPNRAEVVNVSGYPAFRQVAWADSDRHFTYFGLGVGARLPFRAFTLPDPSSMTSSAARMSRGQWAMERHMQCRVRRSAAHLVAA
jgi:hypothetical protein